jgi:dihydroorotase
VLFLKNGLFIDNTTQIHKNSVCACSGMIDPHVHCRDGRQSHKETIEHALKVAELAGLSGIFDMPNTDPPITTLALADERLAIADRAKSPVFYGLYMGLTADQKQVGAAVSAWRKRFPRIVGLKMFAGHSVGNLAVIEESAQRGVYHALREEGFTGVLAVHCEKETYLQPKMWRPSTPAMHSFVRPAAAEMASLEDQLQFSREEGFAGTLHIPHVSWHYSIYRIDAVRNKGQKVTCGLTPHHALLSIESMPDGPEGLFYKVNPPLRYKEDAELMLPLAMGGLIDWFESDHAPHKASEKLNEPYMSGFPGLPFAPHFIKRLKKEGFKEMHIKAMTHDNICKTFGFDIPERVVEPKFDLHTEYDVDVYTRLR